MIQAELESVHRVLVPDIVALGANRALLELNNHLRWEIHSRLTFASEGQSVN